MEASTTPATQDSASAADAGTKSSEDKEMQEEVAQWKQRLTTLRDKENFEDKV